ncbi:UNVERIFIED_CONTAM: hypothetical protein Sindi_1784700 [Sesamum indicum]
MVLGLQKSPSSLGDDSHQGQNYGGNVAPRFWLPPPSSERKAISPSPSFLSSLPRKV